MARIVVIEDEDFTRLAVRHVLEGLGHEVFTATNGIEGMEAFRRNLPDLVLTDIFMPERDGLEMVRELKRDHPTIKVICMSAGSRSDASSRITSGTALDIAEMLGADASIAKPFTTTQLATVLDAVLAA